MIIRAAMPSDARELSEMYAYYVERFSYSFEYEAPSVEEFRGRMIEALKFYPYFVCEIDGSIAGFAYAHTYRERPAYQWVAETSIYTKKGLIRSGVGRVLYTELIKSLKKQGFAKAIAMLGCPNEASEAFHKAMGFEMIAFMPKLGFKLGEWHDVKAYMIELNDLPSPAAPPKPFSEIGWPGFEEEGPV